MQTFAAANSWLSKACLKEVIPKAVDVDMRRPAGLPTTPALRSECADIGKNAGKCYSTTYYYLQE
jgi:hypothetical protein